MRLIIKNADFSENKIPRIKYQYVFGLSDETLNGGQPALNGFGWFSYKHTYNNLTGKKIVGIRIGANTAGTLSIGVQNTGDYSSAVYNIQTVNITTNVSDVMLPQPITIGASETIALFQNDHDTAEIRYANVSKEIGFYFELRSGMTGHSDGNTSITVDLIEEVLN